MKNGIFTEAITLPSKIRNCYLDGFVFKSGVIHDSRTYRTYNIFCDTPTWRSHFGSGRQLWSSNQRLRKKMRNVDHSTHHFGVPTFISLLVYIFACIHIYIYGIFGVYIYGIYGVYIYMVYMVYMVFMLSLSLQKDINIEKRSHHQKRRGAASEGIRLSGTSEPWLPWYQPCGNGKKW